MTPPIEEIASKGFSALSNLMAAIDTTKTDLGAVDDASQALDLYITWRKDNGKL